uniref:Uncharacterized protein n=1 Tax=Cacopsylla melanoneura TaxID=428564 RepID=A0A8D8QUV3_9HEMI
MASHMKCVYILMLPDLSHSGEFYKIKCHRCKQNNANAGVQKRETKYKRMNSFIYYLSRAHLQCSAIAPLPIFQYPLRGSFCLRANFCFRVNFCLWANFCLRANFPMLRYKTVQYSTIPRENNPKSRGFFYSSQDSPLCKLCFTFGPGCA